jgi:tetratricopeptide (TPR) repeat protein
MAERPGMDDPLPRLTQALADRYRIERELGHGGMATVYLADDLKHHRRVAVKVLHPELAALLGPGPFLHEIEISAKLNHPYILPLLDSGNAQGFLFYTMPYVEGESLRERMTREKQLPVEDAIRIARQVADALDYAHRHDVVHRDIKPENILLEEQHAVVADFGIARAISRAGAQKLTTTGVTLGTPEYMSPEQVGGRGELDGRSDIYSLGCVLYEMLAGQPPFLGPTVESLLHLLLAAEPPSVTAIRPTVPAWLAVALERSLAKTPADRFSRAALFAEALAPHAVATETPRTLRIGVVAGAVLAVVVGAALLWPRRSGASLDPNRVLVVAFADQSASPESQELGRMAQDYVIQVLTEAGFAKVVDPLTALAVSRNVGAAGMAGGSRSILALAREGGAGTVVSGNSDAEGDSLYLQIRISNARDGGLMGTVGPIVGVRGARRELVARLGREVAAALAPLLNRELGAFEPASQPATLEAYEAYTEGLDEYLDDAYKVAAQDFERAAAADPTFARARLWAAQAVLVSAASMGDDAAPAKAESLLAPLVGNRGQLGRYDRCRLDFVLAMRKLVIAPIYDAARCMMQAAPGSDDATREVALFALRLNRPQEAIRLLKGLDPDHGLVKRWAGYWSFLSDAYHSAGDFAGELGVAREGQRRYPESPAFLYHEAKALAALGRLDDVAVTLSAMRSLPGAPGLGMYSLVVGQELRVHGYPDAAREVFDQAVAWFQSQPQDSEGARAQTAAALYEAERWDDARACFEELGRQHPGNTTYLALRGLLAARRGDRALAMTISERLRSARPSSPMEASGTSLQRAQILAVLGEKEEAMALLQQWIDQGAPWEYQRFLHLEFDFLSLHDYPPFQELVRLKG